MEFWVQLLDTSDFPPRWYCGQWTNGHGWLHILSDLGVWSAYFAIPGILAYFVLRRSDLPFRKIFLLFVAFILLCGTTHLMEAAIFWWPAYRLAGVIKLLTATVSWATVFALVLVAPRALAMRSPEELEREIEARKRAESELQRVNEDLELRVEQRTSELAVANETLRAEREWFRTTLASIGDGVITTDGDACVNFMNSVAEQLTGWTLDDAQNAPLDSLFKIVNEQTREEAENPVAQALREGKIVGLANHTVLVAKDGSERAIDDSAAPIRDEHGEVRGVVLVFRDVAQQRAAQLAAGRLAALVDSSQDAIIGQTFDGIITEWNAGAERLFGYAANEIIGRSILETVVPPDRKDEIWEILQRVRQGEQVDQFETVRRRRDGRALDVAVRVSPIYDADGTIVAASAIDRDISQARAAELRRNARLAVTQALAQERDVDSAIADILSAVGTSLEWTVGCYWQFHAEENALRCQSFWCSASHDLEEFRAATESLALQAGIGLPGRVWTSGAHAWVSDVTADPNFPRAAIAERAGLQGGFACPVYAGNELLGVLEWFSREIHHPDDDLREMMTTLEGQVGHFIERKNAERALQERERLYRAIGESINYGVWVCDATGRNIYTSDSLLKLVGLTQEACSEFGWGDALHPEDMERTMAAWKKCVRESGVWDHEHRFLGVDGKYHPVLARGVPVKDDEGDIRCWAGINLDIGRLKEVEQALREADRRKDEFLAMLAHELRNPLAPVRSGLEILAMDAAGDHQETVQLMQEQVEHLVRLVDDLLDVSRIMRGKIELRTESVDLASIVNRSVRAIRPLIDSQQQQLTVSLPEQSLWLDVDPVRIIQVIENLLHNASKYTDTKGQIELMAERRDGEVLVHVRDTGVGIEPELLPQVFELFTQSNRSLDRAQGGLGIGLTLVHRLVEMHDGEVSVHSAGVGQGSTFSVRLPLTEKAACAVEQPVVHPQTPRRRILVVDDNVGAARMLSLMLSRLGDHEIDTAHDGPSAVEKIKAMQPEIVFLDIGLPGMDGYQVAKEIRQNPHFDNLYLVALTGYGQDEDRRRSKEAGFNEHLVKPPAVDQLRQVLARPTAPE